MVEDLNQCRDTVEKAIKVYQVPVSGFSIIDNYENVQGQILLQNSSIGAEYYEWDFGNGETSQEVDPVVAYSYDGTYEIELIAINEWGCPDTTILEYELLFKGLYIPSGFAPQGSTEEVRYFRPQGINMKRYSIEVYTLWGNLVWSSSLLTKKGQPAEAWNGFLNNDKNEEMMNAGNYIWNASATFVDDTVWKGMLDEDGNLKTSGTITLIR
jgi:hypothetical protein